MPPRLCDILTWLSELPSRGIATAEDIKFIKAVRRSAMAADQMYEKLIEWAETLRGEER